jgi:hypothetical protein
MLGSSFNMSGSRFIVPGFILIQASCPGFGFFAGQKWRGLRLLLLHLQPLKLILGKPHRARGGPEARENLKL